MQCSSWAGVSLGGNSAQGQREAWRFEWRTRCGLTALGRWRVSSGGSGSRMRALRGRPTRAKILAWLLSSPEWASAQEASKRARLRACGRAQRIPARRCWAPADWQSRHRAGPPAPPKQPASRAPRSRISREPTAPCAAPLGGLPTRRRRLDFSLPVPAARPPTLTGSLALALCSLHVDTPWCCRLALSPASQRTSPSGTNFHSPFPSLSLLDRPFIPSLPQHGRFVAA